MHHGDVRRMLLTCKAIAEGSRSMMYETSMLADYMLKAETEAEHKKVDEEMGFLTPILKGQTSCCFWQSSGWLAFFAGLSLGVRLCQGLSRSWGVKLPTLGCNALAAMVLSGSGVWNR